MAGGIHILSIPFSSSSSFDLISSLTSASEETQIFLGIGLLLSSVGSQVVASILKHFDKKLLEVTTTFLFISIPSSRSKKEIKGSHGPP